MTIRETHDGPRLNVKIRGTGGTEGYWTAYPFKDLFTAQTAGEIMTFAGNIERITLWPEKGRTTPPVWVWDAPSA